MYQLGSGQEKRNQARHFKQRGFNARNWKCEYWRCKEQSRKARGILEISKHWGNVIPRAEKVALPKPRSPQGAGSCTWGREWMGKTFSLYWEQLGLKDQVIALTRWPRPMWASRRYTARASWWRMCNPCRPPAGTLCSETQTSPKNTQVRLHQTKKFLHSKGNYQENEKATYGMGENICKSYLC